MTTILENRPSVFKGVATTDPVYVQGQDAEGIYGYLLLDFKQSKCLVHLAVIRWSKKTLRGMIEDWKAVLRMCRERKCTELVAVNPDETDKWYKFLRHFGFVEYKTVRAYYQEV